MSAAGDPGARENKAIATAGRKLAVDTNLNKITTVPAKENALQKAVDLHLRQDGL